MRGRHRRDRCRPSGPLRHRLSAPGRQAVHQGTSHRRASRLRRTRDRRRLVTATLTWTRIVTSSRSLSRCSCGASAVRTLGSISYCAECVEIVLAPIRVAVAERDGIGFGFQIGRRRFDWGRRWAELACSLCDASWVGPIGERCYWCERRVELRARWLADDERRAAFERRRVPGVLRCDVCHRLFDDAPMIERAVCGVHGGSTRCNGRLQAVYK